MVVLAKGEPSNVTIEIDIDDIPLATAIYILSVNEVILNKSAFELLGMKSNEAFDLTTWKKINPFMKDFVKKHVGESVTDQKIQVILFNGKQEILQYSLACISSPTLGIIYLVYFTKFSDKQSTASFSSLFSIKEELMRLKPYLNRTGKTMYRTLMKKYFEEESRQLTLDDLVSYEKELRIIQQTFPILSHREMILCSLLANDLDISDIALITNRTPESVSVTIHRINKKLDFMNRKELIDNLKELLQDVNSDESDRM